MEVVHTKKVNTQGHVTGLKAYAGREVVIVPRPQLPKNPKVQKALQRPRAILGEFTRFAREHGDLSVTQYRQFSKRYGDPAERVRSYASKMTPQEFRARAKQIEELVQRRLVEIANDVERRYESLETEVEESVQHLFGRKASNGSPSSKKPRGATGRGSTPRKRSIRAATDDASSEPDRGGPGEVQLGAP